MQLISTKRFRFKYLALTWYSCNTTKHDAPYYCNINIYINTVYTARSISIWTVT